MNRNLPATEKALALVRAGKTPYRAAKDAGIALSTIYRAIKREKLKLLQQIANR